MIIKNWGKIKKGVASAVSFVADKVRSLINFFKGVPGAILGALGDLGAKIKDALNPGGVLDKAGALVPQDPGVADPASSVTRAGLTLVGEAGPRWSPSGAARRCTRPPPLAPGAAGGGGATTAHFYLDRRRIATAVAQRDADVRARR